MDTNCREGVGCRILLKRRQTCHKVFLSTWDRCRFFSRSLKGGVIFDLVSSIFSWQMALNRGGLTLEGTLKDWFFSWEKKIEEQRISICAWLVYWKNIYRWLFYPLPRHEGEGGRYLASNKGSIDQGGISRFVSLPVLVVGRNSQGWTLDLS